MTLLQKKKPHKENSSLHWIKYQLFTHRQKHTHTHTHTEKKKQRSY